MTHDQKDRGKVTRACVDAKWAELEAACESAPRPTAKQRRAAVEALTSDLLTGVVSLERPEVPTWRAPFGLMGFLVLVVLAVLLCAVHGCVGPEVHRNALKLRDTWETYKANTTRTALPPSNEDERRGVEAEIDRALEGQIHASE